MSLCSYLVLCCWAPRILLGPGSCWPRFLFGNFFFFRGDFIVPNLNEAFPKKKGDGEEEEGAGKKPRPYFMRAIEEGLVKIDTTFPLVK